VDGASVAVTWSTYSGTSNIDFTVADHSIGATVSGSNKYNGDLADFYLMPGVHVNLNDSTILGGLIASNGRPVATDPTAAASLIMHFGGPFSTWHTNDGT